MLTNEQVRVLNALRVEYPESEGIAPRKSTDESIAPDYVLFVPVANVTTQIDCGGECGRDHIEYYVVMPDGMKAGSLFGPGGVVSNTFGEAMQPQGWDDAESVHAEDFPVQDAAIESDPWLGLDF